MATVALYTNAPPSYDYPQNVEASVMPGCRVLDCPEDTVDYQIGRNQFAYAAYNRAIRAGQIEIRADGSIHIADRDTP